MQKRGYWYNTNTGEVIDVSASRHIQAVVSTPEKFSISKVYIVERYQHHQEPLGFEGKARIEILQEIVKNTDWVRIREYEDRENYRVVVDCNSPYQKDLVLSKFNFPFEYYQINYL